MFPFPKSAPPVASPCIWLSQTRSTTNRSDFLRRICLLSVVPDAGHTRAFARGNEGSPKFRPYPSPTVPWSKTPPDSPMILPFAITYFRLPSVRRGRHPVAVVTRLNPFTCVTARLSLCLHLTHIVTSMSPRLDSGWSGSPPFPDGNFTRWIRPALLGVPKLLRISHGSTAT